MITSYKKIKINNYSLKVDKKTELFKINELVINEGETVCLDAPSGFGKTSLIKSIIEDSKIVNDFRNEMVYIDQEKTVFKNLSIYDNITLGRGKKKENINHVKNLMEEMKINKHNYKEKASILSGGENQRMIICRALFLKNKLLIADEAFAGIDEKTAIEIIEIIKEKFKTIIFTTHSSVLRKAFGGKTINLIDFK